MCGAHQSSWAGQRRNRQRTVPFTRAAVRCFLPTPLLCFLLTPQVIVNARKPDFFISSMSLYEVRFLCSLLICVVCGCCVFRRLLHLFISPCTRCACVSSQRCKGAAVQVDPHLRCTAQPLISFISLYELRFAARPFRLDSRAAALQPGSAHCAGAGWGRCVLRFIAPVSGTAALTPDRLQVAIEDGLMRHVYSLKPTC